MQRLLVLALVVVGACGFDHGVEMGVDAPTETVTVAFDGDAAMVDEASGMVTIPVSLSGVSTVPVTVDYSVGNATTATRPDDFTLADGTLTFMPGQVDKTIDVAIAMDTLEEPDEAIVVQLSHAVGATLGAASYTVTISSDILPRVSFMDATPSSAGEATSPQVTLQLTIAPKAQVTVELGVAGTASAADRGVTDGQVVTFAANQTTATVALGVVQDQLDEDDETVDLSLKNPSTGLLVATTNATHTHTITDDDPMPMVGFAAATAMTAESQGASLTVQLSAPSGRAVTVGYAATFGTATSADATLAPGMLTFMPGETTKTIAVAVTNDAIDEANETLSVTLANPTNATLAASVTTLTIVDDDDPPSIAFAQAATSTAETMSTVNLTVQLSAPSSFDVSVPFSVDATSTADNPEDYTLPAATTLMIPAGMTSGTIAVHVKADTLDEANETVVVKLGTPANATLGAIATTTLTITDDDNGPTVAFTSMGSSPNENNANITLTVQLSDISGQDVTVPFSLDPASTATSPDDFTLQASPVVIPAGNTSTTITIAMKEDAIAEPDETVIVVLGTPTNATLATPSSYTLTIRDDD